MGNVAGAGPAVVLTAGGGDELADLLLGDGVRPGRRELPTDERLVDWHGPQTLDVDPPEGVSGRV